MVIEFDPIAKYIKITSGVSITALEIYNTTMDWCDAPENIGYSIPMSAVGKAPLGEGVFSDSIFVLQNGWKIKLYDGTYQFTIFGTVITDDETARTVPPDSGNVEVVFQVSSQATVIGGEGVWSQTEKNGIIADVDTIQSKTENLPLNPASEPNVTNVGQALNVHDTEIKGNPGWTGEESLKEIKATLDELKTAIGEPEEKKPKSMAQVLEEQLNG